MTEVYCLTSPKHHSDSDFVITCALQICPEWGEWGPFGECTQTCGGGERLRFRSCITDPLRPQDICTPGDAIELNDCNLQVFLLSGIFSDFYGNRHYMYYVGICLLKLGKVINKVMVLVRVCIRFNYPL